MSLQDATEKRNVGNEEAECDVLWMVLDSIGEEAKRAFDVYNGFASPHEGYAVIKEEVDEFWADIKRDRYSDASEEAKQIAAMCVQFMLQYRGVDSLNALLRNNNGQGRNVENDVPQV